MKNVTENLFLEFFPSKFWPFFRISTGFGVQPFFGFEPDLGQIRSKGHFFRIQTGFGGSQKSGSDSDLKNPIAKTQFFGYLGWPSAGIHQGGKS